MTRTAFNKRYDYIAHLATEPRLVCDEPEPPKRREKWVIRASHLKARRYHPTHPLLKIAKKLPRKLTPAQLEGLPHDELARRFRLATSKFKWNPRSVWS